MLRRVLTLVAECDRCSQQSKPFKLVSKGHPTNNEPDPDRFIDHLTKRDGESYKDFVERAAQNKIAARVKMADLEDNMSDLKPGHGLFKRYRPAHERLSEVLKASP